MRIIGPDTSRVVGPQNDSGIQLSVQGVLIKVNIVDLDSDFIALIQFPEVSGWMAGAVASVPTPGSHLPEKPGRLHLAVDGLQVSLTCRSINVGVSAIVTSGNPVDVIAQQKKSRANQACSNTAGPAALQLRRLRLNGT